MEDYVTFLRRDIAESVIGEQVIRRLVDFNFAGVENYPQFVWQPRKGKVAIASVSDITALIDSKLVSEADYGLLRERLDLPPAGIEPVEEAA